MEILIVGQGIAGSLLAWELLERGHNVTIVDDEHSSCASKVAAGVLTPVTGKRFALSWEYRLFYKHARKTYNKLSDELKEKLFFEKSTLRIFRSEHERALWQKKKNNPHFRGFDITDQPALKFRKWVNDPFGSKIMKNSAWCQAPILLDKLQSLYKDRGILKTETFDYSDFEPGQDHVTYKGKAFDKVIFCEGYKIEQNPYFKWVQFKSAKGEILLIEAHLEDFPDYILNFGKWSLPIGNGKFRVGSTYDWEKLDEVATEEGQAHIMEAVMEQIHIDAKVIDHQAGVRPVTQDVLPIIGFHPEYSRIGVVNGLGSKGILRAPYLCAHFADVLENNKKIWDKVNVARFWDQDQKA